MALNLFDKHVNGSLVTMNFKNANQRIGLTQQNNLLDFLFANFRGGFTKHQSPSIPHSNGSFQFPKDRDSRYRNPIMRTIG